MVSEEKRLFKDRKFRNDLTLNYMVWINIYNYAKKIDNDTIHNLSVSILDSTPFINWYSKKNFPWFAEQYCYYPMSTNKFFMRTQSQEKRSSRLYRTPSYSWIGVKELACWKYSFIWIGFVEVKLSIMPEIKNFHGRCVR